MKEVLGIIGLVASLLDVVILLVLAFKPNNESKLSGKDDDKLFYFLIVIVAICSALVLICNLVSLFLK